MEFTFYGHACFKIDTGKESLLFDPFLSGNSQAAVSADKVECDYILLSHAHGDHFGDADKIAKRERKLAEAQEELKKLEARDY